MVRALQEVSGAYSTIGFGIVEWGWPSSEHQHPPRAEPKARQRADWNFPLGAGTVAPIMSPAKFSFNTATADCTNDYVVYALNVAGSDTQPNIVRLNSIYAGPGGLCGSSPTLKSAYQVNTRDVTGLLKLNGQMLTSPILSLDGTKIAFIETVTSSTLACPGLTLPSTCSISFMCSPGENQEATDPTTAPTVCTPQWRPQAATRRITPPSRG